jgi:preprotein translocase subunit SecA
VDEVIARDIEKHAPENTSRDEWNVEAIASLFNERFGEKAQDLDAIAGGREELARALYSQAEKLFNAREGDAEPELILRAFKSLMLEEVDRAWMDHLTNMEHLRDGNGLRSFGQRDPKLEYKKEGFDMFTAMMQSVNAGVLTKLFHIQVRREEELAQMEVQEARRYEERQRRMVATHAGDSGVDEGSEADLVSALASLGLDPSKVQAVRARAPKSRSTGASVPSAPRPSVPSPSTDVVDATFEEPGAEGAAPAENLQAVRTRAPKIGRNEMCPCGSGKKYKDCHGVPGTTPKDSTPA